MSISEDYFLITLALNWLMLLVRFLASPTFESCDLSSLVAVQLGLVSAQIPVSVVLLRSSAPRARVEMNGLDV